MAKLTKSVGRQFLKMLMSLGNASVGQVTVWHMWADEVIIRCDKGDEEGAQKIFSAMFGPEKGKGGYIPAYHPLMSKEAISYCDVWLEEMSEIAIRQIYEMEYSIQNMRAAANDMKEFARAAQERTIDAIKLYDKIELVYKEEVKKAKLLSRIDEPCVKIAWIKDDFERELSGLMVDKVPGKHEGGYIRQFIEHKDALVNIAPKGKPPKIVINIADSYHKLSLDCVRLSARYANKAMNFNPSLSKNMMDWIDSVVLKSAKFAAMVYVCMFYKENLFRSLSSLQTNELKNIRKLFKREQLREQERMTKARYRTAYKYIGNLLKMYAVQFGLYNKNEWGNGNSMLARAAVWASFHTKKNGQLALVNDRVASNFADCTLEREFAGLMYDNMLKAGEKVATEAVAPLARCLAENGDTLRFVENEAWSQDGATLLAEVEGEETIPDGEYRIRWNDKSTKAFAVKSIRNKDGKGDVFAGEPMDNTKFAFMLSFKEDGYDYAELVKTLAKGKEITLLPWKSGVPEKNMVVVDGQVMAKYRSFNFAYSGVVPATPDYAAHKTATQKEVTTAENKICGGRTGKVSAVFSGLADGGKVVVILMEDVKSISPKDVKVTVPVKKAAAPAAAGNFQLNMAGLVSTLKPVETPPVFSVSEEGSATSTVATASKE